MFRARINQFLESSIVEKIIIFLIVVNIIVFILDTEKTLHLHFGKYFYLFEFVSVIIFSIEYFLRVLSLKHFKDLFKPMLLIDLLAILPLYLSFITINTIFLRLLRLFKLLRIFKLTRYNSAFENIKNSFLNKKNELIVTFAIFSIGVIVSSIFIYFAEYNTGVDGFSSIPRAFWWSVITFTSVGYGDVYPITAIGKVIGATVAIMGVGIHGLLVGIIGSAFIESFQIDKKLDK